MNNKAQGTIEYLVIIAIVVVIALVVVGLLLQILGNFGGANETALKTAWKTAEPWAIQDWSRSSTNGDITLILKNNSSETLTVTSTQVTASDVNGDDFLNIAPQATVSIIVPDDACSAGTKYSYPKDGISIDYNNGVIAKKQYGVADIAGTC